MTLSPKLQRKLEKQVAKLKAKREEQLAYQQALRNALQGTRMPSRSTIPAKRATPRRGRPSDPRYRAWVTRQSCAVAGRTYVDRHGRSRVHVCSGRIDPHHVKTRGAFGPDRGNTAPLCRRAHDLVDSPDWGPKTFDERFGVELARVAQDLLQFYVATEEGCSDPRD